MKPLLAAAFFSIISPAFADTIYIGTNTGGNSESKGIYLAIFDTATGKITDIKLAAEYPSPGFLTQHPTLPVLYASGGSGTVAAFNIEDDGSLTLLNELDNTITTVQITDNSYQPIQTIPTLPEDFKEQNTTAEVEVHPNGKFVYSSNRGHESITVYQRDSQSGKLTVIEHAPSGGVQPRHFKISPDGKWLLCGHQASNTISMLAIDPKTGKLGEPSNTVSTTTPICIHFAR